MLAMARALVVVALGASLLGCAPGDGGADAGSDAGSSDVDTYSAGMMKMGEALHFVLVEASPAPPDVGDNTWTVRVTDMSDEPVDAQVTVTPWMPAHDHGTTPADFSGTPTGTAGEHSVGPFNLVMPGLWEITVSADDGAGTSDEVVFRFDIEG